MVYSALIPVCKQVLEGSLKLEDQCIVVFPSLAHKTLLFVMPYDKIEEVLDSDEEKLLLTAEDEPDTVMGESGGERGIVDSKEVSL